MKIINLTPHKITFINGDQNQIEIPSSGTVRISEATVPVGEVEKIPLVRKVYGKAEGLPDEKPDTIYIVSAMVRLAYPERNDLASPGDLIRDENGAVIGCRNLIIN